MYARKLAIAVAAVSAMAMASCSPNGPEVPVETTGASLEGQVLYGEQPVANALVIVVAPKGSPSGGTQAFADDEGRYKIENVPVGTVQIAVNSDASKGMMIGRSMSGTNPLDRKGKKAAAVKVTDVPKQFHNPSTSKLELELKRGVNKFDIKIPK